MNTNKDDLLTRISKWLMPSMWSEEPITGRKLIREGCWGPATQKRPDPPPAPPRPGRVSRPRKTDIFDPSTAIVAATIVSDSSSGGGDW